MRQDITWCQRHRWETVMADRLVVVACGTTGFVRRSEVAGNTVRRRDRPSCLRVKSGHISSSISRAPSTPTPWFTRSLRTSTSTMMSLDWLSRRGFLPTPEPSLMRFPSTGVMCVWNVVNGMQFTSANKRTPMRSFSGLAASSSHFATASVMRFKPPPLDQFCRDAFCFLALGCSAEAAACSGGSLAAGAASGFLSSQVKNYSPGNMEQAPSRGHEASPQSGLGVGCKRCSSSKKLRGLGVYAQTRHISTSLSFSVLGVSSFLSPPRSAMRRGAWKCNAGSR